MILGIDHIKIGLTHVVETQHRSETAIHPFLLCYVFLDARIDNRLEPSRLCGANVVNHSDDAVSANDVAFVISLAYCLSQRIFCHASHLKEASVDHHILVRRSLVEDPSFYQLDFHHVEVRIRHSFLDEWEHHIARLLIDERIVGHVAETRQRPCRSCLIDTRQSLKAAFGIEEPIASVNQQTHSHQVLRVVAQLSVL